MDIKIAQPVFYTETSALRLTLKPNSGYKIRMYLS